MSDLVEEEVPGTSLNPFKPEEARESNTAIVSVESARAIAEIQAAMVMAHRFPRKPVECMDLILQDCTMPVLAENATYDYKRGGTDIVGPTIRLAEAMARRWGHLDCGVMELSRHEGFSECQSYAWDLETGYKERRTFQVRHWRDKEKGEGGYALKTERDIYELVANMGARRKRACILAVIPPDVVQAALRQCEVTLRAKVTINQELVDSLIAKFAKHSVTREMLETKIQRRLAIETLTPALVIQLGRIYNSLEDDASEPKDWFKTAETEKGEETTKHGRARPKAKKKDGPDAGAGATGKPPEPTTEPDALTKLVDAEQLAFIRNKAKTLTITEPEICRAFQLESLEKLRAAVVPAVLQWLSDPTSKPPL